MFSRYFGILHLTKHTVLKKSSTLQSLISGCNENCFIGLSSSNFHNSVLSHKDQNDDGKRKPDNSEENSRSPEKSWGAESIPGMKEQYSPYLDRVRYRKLYKNPIDRTLGILKDDVIEFLGGTLKRTPLVNIKNSQDESVIESMIPPNEEIFPDHCDVVIVGGGVVGASIAYHLQEKARAGLRIVVVEKDLSYTKAATVLSVGGIRQQFSLAENIELSQYGFEFLRKAHHNLAVDGSDPPNVGMDFHGYLTLATEEGMDQLRENYILQRKSNAAVALLSAEELKQRYPWINTEGVAGGVYGLKKEGWFDPWALVLGLVRRAQSFGTHLINAEVVDFNTVSTGDVLNFDMDYERIKRVNSVEVKLPDESTRSINCSICILAAGPWTGELGKLAGIGSPSATGSLVDPIPIEARKRYVYCIDAPDGPGLNCPLLVDPTGTYFRREGLADMYLCGRSPLPGEEPDHSDLSVDLKFFEEKVWPVIANRCPGFEKLKVRSSWAGYYDYNTFDQNGIVGHHPSFVNLIVASGFSGHGIQQAPGVGRAVMELILEGEFTSINLERMGYERIVRRDPLYEKNIV